MLQLSKENGVDLGTGYPHDPLSISYIRKYIHIIQFHNLFLFL